MDFSIGVLTALGTAMPNFWIAILLILLFALYLRILPSAGTVPLSLDPLGHFRALVLPTITLSASYFANLARLTRAKMVEVLDSDYIRPRARRACWKPGFYGCMRSGTPCSPC